MGLLDGELASIVADALVSAEMSLPATLTKVTPGTRTPGAISAGRHSSTTDYPVQAIAASTSAMRIAGTLIAGVDRVIRIFGASLPAGVVPTPGDRVTMDGATSTIVGDSAGLRAVTVDAAKAMYTCQCRS
jgi:hypothetical protein